MFLKLPSRIDADLLSWVKCAVFRVFVVEIAVSGSFSTSADESGPSPEIESDPHDAEGAEADDSDLIDGDMA